MATATTSDNLVADLMNPQSVRNDIAFGLGVLGVVASVVLPHWNVPVVPDAVLGAVSGLAAVLVRGLATLVHGGLSKSSLEHDAADLKADIPGLKEDVATLLPFVEKELPQFKDTVLQASKDAAEAKTLAAGLQEQVAKLPADQAAATEGLLARLSAALGTPPPAPAPVAPVVDPTPAPTPAA